MSIRTGAKWLPQGVFSESPLKSKLGTIVNNENQCWVLLGEDVVFC